MAEPKQVGKEGKKPPQVIAGVRRKTMITVAKCRSGDEAETVRSRLEAAGIPAFVPDALSWYDGLLMFMGGFRVQVPEQHAQTARQLLQSKDEPDENVKQITGASWRPAISRLASRSLLSRDRETSCSKCSHSS